MRRDGFSVLLTSEPSDGPVGALIKSLTSRPKPEEEAHLFTEDRRDHLRRVIIPALNEGRVVICDRYVYSSAAYQGARGLDPAAIIAENCAFALRPHVTFLLEIPVQEGLARIRSGRGDRFSTFEVEEEVLERAQARMPEESAHERRKDFREVELGYTRTLAVEEAGRCMRCDVKAE